MGVRVFFSTARDVLQCTMMTHQILLRGAAQCYLLQTAMNLVDVSEPAFPLRCHHGVPAGSAGTPSLSDLNDHRLVDKGSFLRSMGDGY